MTESAGPVFGQLNIITADLAASLAFYARLGITPQADPDGRHASCELPGGLALDFDSADFAALWDSGSRGPAGQGGGVVLGFTLGGREAVDKLYAELTAAGYHGHQVPYDAFWGARYAIVDDPDGNAVGLMSRVSADQKYWPPRPAPSA